MESIGISTKSSGILVITFWFGCFFENFMRTESISSSRTVGVLTTSTFASSILVTDSRFSTIRISHSLSSWISPSSFNCCSFGSASYLEMSVEVEPYIEVRGVRRSWEIARSRLPRILSFSLSERNFSCSRTRSISCSLIRMFSVLVETATISIITAEKMLSSTKKSKA